MYYVDLAVTGVSFGCMYAMMSVGLTLVYGLLRILHIAHAAVFALGAYITVLVANATGSFALGFLAALAVTPVFGMAVYRLLYEPLLQYRPDVPMVASVGLLIFMQDAFRILFGEQGVTFQNNTLAFKTFDIGSVRIGVVQAALIASAAVVFVGLHALTTRTRVGVGWRATVSRPKIAASFGVDPIRVRYLNFALGSALAALAGGLVALLDNLVDPVDRIRRELQSARHHRAGRPRQRARNAHRQPRPWAWSNPTAPSSSVAWLDRDAIAFLAVIALLMIRPQGFTGVRAA